jgi:hypothetical protein
LFNPSGNQYACAPNGGIRAITLGNGIAENYRTLSGGQGEETAVTGSEDAALEEAAARAGMALGDWRRQALTPAPLSDRPRGDPGCGGW